MRVIAGQWGGRRLQAPAGAATRPTSDRVREALFSILGDRVAGLRVLDLFAGSGALGIEALSRGAAEAVFVDSDQRAVAAIRRNLEAVGGRSALRAAAGGPHRRREDRDRVRQAHAAGAVVAARLRAGLRRHPHRRPRCLSATAGPPSVPGPTTPSPIATSTSSAAPRRSSTTW